MVQADIRNGFANSEVKSYSTRDNHRLPPGEFFPVSARQTDVKFSQSYGDVLLMVGVETILAWEHYPSGETISLKLGFQALHLTFHVFIDLNDHLLSFLILLSIVMTPKSSVHSDRPFQDSMALQELKRTGSLCRLEFWKLVSTKNDENEHFGILVVMHSSPSLRGGGINSPRSKLQGITSAQLYFADRKECY
jgi:hypothetical protein